MRKANRRNAQSQPTAARTEFRDLERYRWHFFLRPYAPPNGAYAYTLPDSFVDALNAAGAWLGWSEGALLRPDLHAASAELSQRLVVAPATEWREHDGTLRTLEARTLLDACYLQLGAAIEGALDPNSPRALRDAFPAIDAGEHHLGVAEGWCLMLAEGEPNEAALRDALERLALPTDGCLTFATQGGWLALYPDALVACILYAPAQTQPMSYLLHQLLPAFLLNLLKIRLLREQYPPLKSQVAQQETRLEHLMAQAREAHRLSIEQIEQHSVQLAQQQAHYLETLSQIEEWLHTLKTLQDNLRRLLRDPLWYDGDGSAPARRLLEPIQLLIDQLQSDLHYFHITRQQADLHLQSLNTASGVRIAKWNRRITLLVGIFVVLELPQAFPELNLAARIALILAGALVLIAGNWYFIRR